MRLRPLARRGLTLIELTVVLLILAATAGILVPRLTGYGERAHGSTTAASMNETAKALALFEANNGSLPNNWDNLIEAGGGLPASLTEGTVPTVVNPGTLASQEEADALRNAGITTVHNFDSARTDFNATFDPWARDGTGAVVATNVADGMAIATVDADQFGLPNATSKVVLLGINSVNGLNGAVIANAPVVFEGSLSPETTYLRVLAAFEIVSGGNALEKARLLGVVKVEPADGSLAGAGTHLQVYYDSRDQ